jgi:radical SAM protein with 4Fe4S-binding SPASM domain
VWRAPGAEASACPPDELSTEATLAMLAKVLDETRCSHITLTGGEPLMRSDLPQIIDLARGRGARVTIISNGRLLTEPAVVDLVQRGVGLFELPLLSHQRQVHDDLSGAPGAFDAVLAAMARIRYHQGQFVAVFVATQHNLPHLVETIRLAFAFGSRGMMLNRFNPGGRGRDRVAELLPTVDQMRRALAAADGAAAELSFPISCSIPIQPCLIDLEAYRHLGFGFCAAGTDRAYYTLDPVGNVRPCNHTSTILGNVRHEPFWDLVAPERLSPFVSAVPRFCRTCALRTTCQGGCKAAAQVCYGDLRAEEPFLHHHRDRATPVDLAPDPGPTPRAPVSTECL